MNDSETFEAFFCNVERSERTASRPVVADRPQIKVTIDQSAAVDAAEAALGALGEVYVRGRQLVHVVRDRGGADWIRRPDGAPVIELLPRERLRELLGRAASWVQWCTKRETYREVSPPAWVAEMLIARGQWPTLPALEGVVHAPALRADGSILDRPGYDAASRLIYDPMGVAYPPVPDAPTREDAARALDVLGDPVSEFAWVSASDGAAWIALVLSLVGRAAIDGPVPMHGIGATAPGSGKSLLADVAAIIATGRAAPKVMPTADDDELRKQLLAIALAGDPLIVIDNVAGALGSPVLAGALTAGEIKQRLLGQSRDVTATLRAVWAFTGNGVALRGDLGRRVVPVDLDPRCEHPEDRTGWRYPDLLAHVRTERPRLVAAALTILRAYVVAGRPGHGAPPKGSYEAWDRLVRGAIVWASGGVDPLGGVTRIREAGDADLEALRALLAAWRAAFGDRAVAVARAIAVADALRVEGGEQRVAGEVQVALRAALAPYASKGGRLDATALGYALRRLKGRVASVPGDDGRSVAARLESVPGRAGSAAWRVVPC